MEAYGQCKATTPHHLRRNPRFTIPCSPGPLLRGGRGAPQSSRSRAHWPASSLAAQKANLVVNPDFVQSAIETLHVLTGDQASCPGSKENKRLDRDSNPGRPI